jgi:hypothetical protein
MGISDTSHGMSRDHPIRMLSNVLQTSWGSRADGDTNDSQRMTPRARRSESITLPPGNHPVLIRYKDDKSYTPSSEKPSPAPSISSEYRSESDLDAVSINLSNDPNDSNDDSDASSTSD